MQNQKTQKHKQKHSEQQKNGSGLLPLWWSPLRIMWQANLRIRVYCRYGEALTIFVSVIRDEAIMRSGLTWPEMMLCGGLNSRSRRWRHDEDGKCCQIDMERQMPPEIYSECQPFLCQPLPLRSNGATAIHAGPMIMMRLMMWCKLFSYLLLEMKLSCGVE